MLLLKFGLYPSIKTVRTYLVDSNVQTSAHCARVSAQKIGLALNAFLKSQKAGGTRGFSRLGVQGSNFNHNNNAKRRFSLPLARLACS